MAGKIDAEAIETLAAVFAGMQAGAGAPRMDPYLLERIAPSLGTTVDDLFADRKKLDAVRKALRVHDENRLLPPTPARSSRLVHSILKLPSDVDSEIPVLLSIIKDGLVASPEGIGRHSEAPGLVFFVAFDPEDPAARYNKYNSWVVFDVPHDWDGWGGATGAWYTYGRGLSDPPRPGGVVGIWNRVPPEFLVGVNGVPVDDFLKGLEFWQENLSGKQIE